MHRVKIGNVDDVSFEICSKMVSHATMVMLQDSFDDTEGKYTRSRLQRVRLQRAPGYYEQIIYYVYQCSFFDYNVKRFSFHEHPATTTTILCIKLLVVSRTRCSTCSFMRGGKRRERVVRTSMSSERNNPAQLDGIFDIL